MLIPRIIPALLLSGNRLVKTVRFRKPTYLGDPINVIRIFNDKEVDELALLDIDATREGRGPNFGLLSQISGECFMPLGYGGGITTLQQMKELMTLGIEKVILNTLAVERPEVVRGATDRFGSSTIVVSMDVRRRRFWGTEVVTRGGRRGTGMDPVGYAVRMQELGAGELLLTALHRDGSMSGYDLELIRAVTRAVDIPVVASGGAGSLADLRCAIVEGGASAAAAGSLFVFQGPHRAVLITFPPRAELEALFTEGSGQNGKAHPQ
jgi:cyclase